MRNKFTNTILLITVLFVTGMFVFFGLKPVHVVIFTLAGWVYVLRKIAIDIKHKDN